MNIQEYIASGVLDSYVMGMLDPDEEAFVIQMSLAYPEIKAEIAAIEDSLEELARNHATLPPEPLKQRILDLFGFTESTEYPAISKQFDYKDWLARLTDMIPEVPADDFTCKLLRQDDDIEQMLVITKLNVEKEVHSERIESFLILKGQCKCTIGDQLYYLNPGDFLEIPLHIEHDIQLLTPYVAAILQYQAA